MHRSSPSQRSYARSSCWELLVQMPPVICSPYDRGASQWQTSPLTSGRQSDWNTAAFRNAFLHGLADYIKDELVSYPVPSTLDGFIELSTQLDLRIRARRRERRQNAVLLTSALHPSSPPASASSSPAMAVPVEPEPMQLGRTKLTQEEQEGHRTGSLCMYCGQAGHFISHCSLKGRAHQ